MGNLILLVDSDAIFTGQLGESLKTDSCVPVVAASALEALDKIMRSRFDLIVIETELPDMNGIDLIREFNAREETANVPIVIVSVLAGEFERIIGLSLGATDYVTKPCSFRELVLRIKVILRRKKNEKNVTVLRNGSLRADLARQKAFWGETQLPFTVIEFKIFALLLRATGQVLSRDKILKEVWGSHAHVSMRTVDVHIQSLRKKMGNAKDALETVQGVGYRMEKMTPMPRLNAMKGRLAMSNLEATEG